MTTPASANGLIVRKNGNPLRIPLNSREIVLSEPIESFSHLAQDLATFTHAKSLKIDLLFSKTNNLDFLVAMPWLESLDVSYPASVKDFSGIAQCRSLRRLEFYNECRIDLTTILPLPNLQLFHAFSHGMKNPEALATCSELRELMLTKIQLNSLEPFVPLKHLRYLRIWCCNLPCAQGVGKLRKLEELEIGHSKLAALGDISNATHLVKVSLVGNKAMDDLGPLEPLQLERLDLNEIPSIKSLAPLRRMMTLRSLSAAQSRIEDGDLTPLLDLPHLETCTLKRKYEDILLSPEWLPKFKSDLFKESERVKRLELHQLKWTGEK